jgi:hypothetical protein
MRQRGRKSADLLALRVDGSPPRLQPPATLSDDERALFTELVADCPSEQFVASDLPLLTSFIEATLLARQSARDPAKIDTWERAVRLQATLATRLRLAPQARTDPKTSLRVVMGGPPIERHPFTMTVLLRLFCIVALHTAA